MVDIVLFFAPNCITVLYTVKLYCYIVKLLYSRLLHTGYGHCERCWPNTVGCFDGNEVTGKLPVAMARRKVNLSRDLRRRHDVGE
jgi:hypothetical protein